jgi:hypothetical protein
LGKAPPSGDSRGVKLNHPFEWASTSGKHKSPKSQPGWPNTHQCTSSVLSIVGVQMDESQLQVAQCHLGCSLYFSPFSLLPAIPVTYYQSAGVNQQPPMHQLRMRLFKPFWDEPKTNSPSPKFLVLSASSLAQSFSLLLTPPYLRPTYLTPPTKWGDTLRSF